MDLLYPFDHWVEPSVRFHVWYIYGYHQGYDIPFPSGTPIKAGFSGKVIAPGYNVGYGNYVDIQSGEDPAFVVKYWHLSAFNVGAGQLVNQGDIIAYVGNTGWFTTGAHLHLQFECNGTPCDPAKYFIFNLNDMTKDEVTKLYWDVLYPKTLEKLRTDKDVFRRPSLVQDQATGIVWEVNGKKRLRYQIKGDDAPFLASLHVWRWMADDEKKYKITRNKSDVL